MYKLSIQEQRNLDNLIRGLRLKYDALERGDKEMSPTLKNYIMDLCQIVFLIYEKTDRSA